MSKLFAVDEHQFLPAALEVLETPVSPLKHMLTMGICLLFVLALLWAWLGRLDIIVEAEGRVIPDGQVKTVSPVQVARVKAIHVDEGSYVSQHDLLVELEPNPSDQESLSEQPSQDVTTAQLNLLRLEQLLKMATAFLTLDGMKSPDLKFLAQQQQLDFPAEPTPERWVTEQHALDAELAQFLRSDQAMQRRMDELKAALNADKEEIKRLRLLLPIHDKIAQASKGLYDKKMQSELEWLAHREKQIDTQQQLNVMEQRQSEHRAKLQSTLAEQHERRQAFFSQHHQEQLKATQQLDHARAVLKKARQRDQNQRLAAPVSGYIQQLQVRSEGDVVQPAQPIMVIVPEQARLEAEVMLRNKDIRWLKENLLVKIKVESFPYTRYGHLSGTVRHIAADAINNEQTGWAYPVRIALNQTGFDIDQAHYPLQPGMTLTADVIVGQRRLLEYFLSPLLRYQKETFRETM